MTDVGSPGHTPAQQDVIALLGSPRAEWPQFDLELRHHLRAMLEEAAVPAAEGLGDDRLFVNKYALAQVHGCEARFVHEQQGGFVASVATARGRVAHKAVQLSVTWRGETTPADLVDEAVARQLEGDDWLADWLQTCSESDRAELLAEAGERVTKFMECWPPLKREWRPNTESDTRVELADRRVVLTARPDLSLGQPDGARAGKVLIDLKTGRFSPTHRDDLRFYALVEAIRLGTPPRKVATHYLDTGGLVPEDITLDVLQAAVARTTDGIQALADLRDPARDLVKRPGPPCGWCGLADECSEGRAFLEERDALSL